MEPESINHVTGIPIRSTKGLLLSKPCQLRYPLSTTSSKTNGIEREDSFAVWIKKYARLGHKLIEMMKHKLSYGAKVIHYGSQDKLLRKNFSISEGEKLLQAFQCYLCTTDGAIAGLLFVSTERVAFAVIGPLKHILQQVSIPLGKIKGVNEGVKMKRPSKNYVELVTVNDYSF